MASIDFQVCPDDHKCENGSVCVENPLSEGKYYCDCQETPHTDVFAGLYCQHKATVYCTMSGTTNRNSFCTNEGTCKGLVEDNSKSHYGCDCLKGYTGKHCQFVEGSEPEGFPFDGSTLDANALTGGNVSERGGDGGLIALIIILALVVPAVIGVFVYRRRRAMLETHTIESTKSSDGHLHDAEGEKISVRNTTTPTFDSEIYNGESYSYDHEVEVSVGDGPHML